MAQKVESPGFSRQQAYAAAIDVTRQAQALALAAVRRDVPTLIATEVELLYVAAIKELRARRDSGGPDQRRKR
jgi:hypothetical protein